MPTEYVSVFGHEKWEPYEDNQRFWQAEHFDTPMVGFEWVEDEDGNIVGFIET